MLLRKCTKCKLYKNLSEFPNHKKCKDGKRPECKKCCWLINAEWKRTNHKHYRMTQREWYRENSPRLRKIRAIYREKNRDKIRKQAKEQHKKVNIKIFDLYGKYCVCCNESNEGFLTLDHKNDDGWKDWGLKITSLTIKRKILKGKVPKENYQIMCYNCNLGRDKSPNKICPHKIKKTD